MSDMKRLALMLKELEEQLTVCMKCGMCQSVCPLFEETGREADVARGKLALLDGLGREMFDDPAGVAERLNRCLLCGSCAANCPSGVRVLDIFIKARAILAGYMGLSPIKRAALRGMLAHPERFDRLVAWGSRFQKYFTRPVNDLVGTSCARFVSPLIGGRHFRPIAETPFHERTPALDTAAGASGLRVAFYVGCLLDKIFPEIAEDVVAVLNHHGVGIYMPEGQACCGIPALSSGDLKTFGALTRRNLERFDPGDFDYLVTACATCTSTIKEMWPLMAGRCGVDKVDGVDKADGVDGVDGGKISAIAAKAMDINQFLVSKLGVGAAPESSAGAAVVTYHDPCHLKKSLKVVAEPRIVIRANPECRLVEMPQSDWCCGLGGSFNLQYYQTSAAIGRRKRDNIRAVDPAVVATGCPACMLQISDALSRAGDRVAVRHPVQLYARTLRA